MQGNIIPYIGGERGEERERAVKNLGKNRKR